MANELKGEFEFQTSDGQAYVMRLTNEDLMDCEKEQGRDFMLRIGTGWASLTEIRVLLFHGLRTHHPEITPHHAAEIMADLGPKRCREVWQRAVSLALDPGDREGRRRPKAKPPTTGEPGTGDASSTTP